MNTIYPEVYPDAEPIQTHQMLGTENINHRYRPGTAQNIGYPKPNRCLDPDRVDHYLL
jgi:hypothetical protein